MYVSYILIIWDELIHSRGPLKEKEPQPSTQCRGLWKNLFFLLYSFWGLRRDPLGHPTPAEPGDGNLEKLGEASKG